MRCHPLPPLYRVSAGVQKTSVVEASNNVRLFPSLLIWSVVPWRDSEAELMPLETVSEAELAYSLINVSDR